MKDFCQNCLAGFYLSTDEHNVGSCQDGVGDQVFVVLLHLHGQLLHVLGVLHAGLVLVAGPASGVPDVDLLDVFHTLELDQNNNWINVLLLEFLHRADVNV